MTIIKTSKKVSRGRQLVRLTTVVCHFFLVLQNITNLDHKRIDRIMIVFLHQVRAGSEAPSLWRLRHSPGTTSASSVTSARTPWSARDLFRWGLSFYVYCLTKWYLVLSLSLKWYHRPRIQIDKIVVNVEIVVQLDDNMSTRPVHKNLFLEFPKYPGRFMLHFDIWINVRKGVLLKYRSFIKFWEPPILQGRIHGAELP